MKKKLSFSTIIAMGLLTLLGSCGNALPEIGGQFNSETWKNDELGCGGQRLGMFDDVLAAKSQLVVLREPEIRKLFGRPDQVELFSRSQKFYLYYIEAGGQCSGQGGSSAGRVLEFSLDALGRAHEINLRQ